MRREERSWKVARLGRGVGAIMLVTAAIVFPQVAHDYAAASQSRVLSLEDYYEVKSVGAPAISPAGESIVYVVSQAHRDTDSTVTTLWLAGVDGGTPRAFTHGRDSVSAPAFSPDGRGARRARARSLLSCRSHLRLEVLVVPGQVALM